MRPWLVQGAAFEILGDTGHSIYAILDARQSCRRWYLVEKYRMRELLGGRTETQLDSLRHIWPVGYLPNGRTAGNFCVLARSEEPQSAAMARAWWQQAPASPMSAWRRPRTPDEHGLDLQGYWLVPFGGRCERREC